MQVQTENQERIPLRFEIRNRKSSRSREQGIRAKLSGKQRGRVIFLAGTKVRPRRSEWLGEDRVLKYEEQIRILENDGQIVVRHNDRDINLAEAIRLIKVARGEIDAEAKEGSVIPADQPQPPFHDTSYVNDPQPQAGADASLLRIARDATQVEPAEEVPAEMQTETVDEEGVAAVDAPVVDLGDMAGLEFINESRIGEYTPEPDEDGVGTDGPAKAAPMTVAEAAEWLGQSQGWVRKQLKNGKLTKASERPIRIPFEEIQAVALDHQEEEV